MRARSILTAIVAAAYCNAIVLPNVLLPIALLVLLAASLPTFEDFRRVDRIRRVTGQVQTDELLQVTQVDSNLLVTTAERHADDWQVQWGAAELADGWPNQKKFFQSAIERSGSNTAVLARFACAAAWRRDDERALDLLQACQVKDPSNSLTWLVETWLTYHRGNKSGSIDTPAAADRTRFTGLSFNDYASAAARARILALERAGYSPYAARRLGFMPEVYASLMARDLAQYPFTASAKRVFARVAERMQNRPTFFLTELIGQTLERAIIQGTEDGRLSRMGFRLAELENRRSEIRELIATVERNAVDIASESDMVRYFDDILMFGEESAMQKLLITINRPPGQ